MSDEGSGGFLEATVGAIATAVEYAVVIAELGAAALALRGLGETVRGTYRYVEGCAASVDRIADQMASKELDVDRDTIAEHREAAGVMRSVLAEAESMAAAAEELAVLFEQTSDGHCGDYGPVAEAFDAMDVDPAQAQFYSNR